MIPEIKNVSHYIDQMNIDDISIKKIKIIFRSLKKTNLQKVARIFEDEKSVIRLTRKIGRWELIVEVNSNEQYNHKEYLLFIGKCFFIASKFYVHLTVIGVES